MVRKCRKAKDKPTKDGIGVSSTYMQLRSRRIDYNRSEINPSSVVVEENGVSSCCASNDYRNVVVVDDGFIDLEEDREEGDTETSTYRRNTKRKLFENFNKSMENSSKIGADFESATKESSECCCSGRRSSSTTEEEKTKSTTEQPTEAEIEEFFVEAEKKLQENFKKKYNFDFEKEKPLEGRYEWVKLSE